MYTLTAWATQSLMPTSHWLWPTCQRCPSGACALWSKSQTSFSPSLSSSSLSDRSGSSGCPGTCCWYHPWSDDTFQSNLIVGQTKVGRHLLVHPATAERLLRISSPDHLNAKDPNLQKLKGEWRDFFSFNFIEHQSPAHLNAGLWEYLTYSQRRWEWGLSFLSYFETFYCLGARVAKCQIFWGRFVARTARLTAPTAEPVTAGSGRVN